MQLVFLDWKALCAVVPDVLVMQVHLVSVHVMAVDVVALLAVKVCLMVTTFSKASRYPAVAY